MEIKTVQRRLFDAIKSTGKVEKNKQGFNFKYMAPEVVVEQCNASMQDQGLMLMQSVAPATQYKDNSIINKFEAETKNGKKSQYSAEVQFIFRIVDVNASPETKEEDKTIEYLWAGSGVADQPGQAQGAAATYAERQFLEKLFKLVTNKEEFDDEMNWVADADGLACEKITSDNFTKFMSLLAKHRQTAELQTELGLKVLAQLNTQLNTKYEKISKLPNKYYEEIIKLLSIEINGGK